jgi:hypothetical protein
MQEERRDMIDCLFLIVKGFVHGVEKIPVSQKSSDLPRGDALQLSRSAPAHANRSRQRLFQNQLSFQLYEDMSMF